MQKAPEKFLQKILERCEPAEETFLILFDICHEYKVKSEPIWTLLFERIREPGALMKKMCLLNTASWFHDLCGTSRLLLSNYHMAWNKALVNNLETKWEETILALYQFKRPIRLDIPRLFNLAIQAGYDLTACQIMVKVSSISHQNIYSILFYYFRPNYATENGCAKNLFNKSHQQVSLTNVSF